MLSVFKTHTGKIYVDRGRQLEFLTVGDYGKENNIKADFLGFTREISGVKHREVDLAKKWVVTISTQRGVQCIVVSVTVQNMGFQGNASISDLAYEIETILVNEPETKHMERFNVHFARCGEHTFNSNVLTFAKYHLRPLVENYLRADTIHSVVSTMFPKANNSLMSFLFEWCNIKNRYYHGEAGLQLSINSTDDEQRDYQFRGCSHSLADISRMAGHFLCLLDVNIHLILQ